MLSTCVLHCRNWVFHHLTNSAQFSHVICDQEIKRCDEYETGRTRGSHSRNPHRSHLEAEISTRQIPRKGTIIPQIISSAFKHHLLILMIFIDVVQGGFAKCYELTDLGTNMIYAGKIVSKTLLIKPHQKDKMAQEIAIHRELSHQHVVDFQSFFEDNNFVYIVLELCKRRVLLFRRKT